MTHKSPFYVVEEFISPLMCEDIIERLNNTSPNRDGDGNPTLTIKSNRLTEMRVLPLILDLVPKLEQYYGFTYEGTLPFDFEWYPSGYQHAIAHCDNSSLVKGKWYRTNEKDFVGVIFLNDYSDAPPFDSDFEVVGGKLGFPTHNFSFMPQRGQLVVFPGEQHFVNAIQDVPYGNLNLLKFYISSEEDYVYDPSKFPGNYQQWFA